MLEFKEKKLPFGKRPSKGNFGKKPSSGNFGKKPSGGSFGKKPSSGSFGKTPQKQIPKKSKKNIITIKERSFLKWLHQDEQYCKYSCFVCGKINPDDTIEWHHVKEKSYDKKNHKRLILYAE